MLATVGDIMHAVPCVLRYCTDSSTHSRTMLRSIVCVYVCVFIQFRLGVGMHAYVVDRIMDVTDWDSTHGKKTQMLLKKTQMTTSCHRNQGRGGGKAT